MFTLFAIPKAFRGHSGVIQRNAIQSWTLLKPAPEIILFGNDEGTVEIAREFNLRSVPEIQRNELGTPYISDVFLQAQQLASNNVLVYCNSDIILPQDFVAAVQAVQNHCCIMTGQRMNVDITEPMSFAPGWQSELSEKIELNGKLHCTDGMDYFVFTKGLLSAMPPFLVGRPTWDNWVIYFARKNGIMLIDATDSVVVIHQNHDYSHIPRGEGFLWEGPEARDNRALWKSGAFNFNMEDARYRLRQNIICREWRYSRLRRNLDLWIVLYPGIAWTLPVRKVFSRLVLQPIRRCFRMLR